MYDLPQNKKRAISDSLFYIFISYFSDATVIISVHSPPSSSIAFPSNCITHACKTVPEIIPSSQPFSAAVYATF